MAQPLGLIAGEGIFPMLVARGARAAGRSVVCAAFSGSADGALRDEVDEFKWVGVARLGQWVRVLKSAGCSQAIMVGRVAKHKMYSRWRYVRNIPDFRTLRLWFTELRHDKRDQAVLYAIIRELDREGITLIDSTAYTQDQLASSGVMTRRSPTDAQWIDARYGWDLCQSLSRLDIGQAIAVKDKNILAVEAMEGTNAMVERAGGICRTGGWTLIKVSNIKQDMRIDVPSIGITTIEKLHAAGGACLVVEAARTILLEKEKVLQLADRLKIAVVGCERRAGGELMRITVKLFAAAREKAGESELVLDVAESATVAAAAAEVAEKFPQLGAMLAKCAFAINRAYAAGDAPLHPGDELAVLPPVSGGCF